MTEFKEFCKACFTFDDVQEVLSNDYVIVPKISVATQRTQVSLDHYFTESYLKETLFQYFEIMLLSDWSFKDDMTKLIEPVHCKQRTYVITIEFYAKRK